MKYIVLLVVLITANSYAQQESGAQKFWKNLEKHCGNTYEGTVIEAPENDSFRGNKLVMHVRSCKDDTIRIPFFVGEDKSRTWVLSMQNDKIQLKHDHRHKDGTPDKVTQYGGIASNTGLPTIQFFPADQQTADLISYASTNVWWITLDETSFTYNLRRIGSDRLFTVKFDLTTPVSTPEAPWGWKE